MKVIAQLKLIPTSEQVTALQQTREQANAACNEISRVAWEQQTFGTFALHALVYARIRAEYGLGAQLAIRCLAKVGDSYTVARQRQRTYAKHGAIAFDDRILSFKLTRQTVSLWTVQGRFNDITFLCCERQKHLLQSRQGQSDLVYRKGCFYLLVTCNVDVPPPAEVDDALGVDLGIVNLATDSDGESYSGAQVEQTRQRYAKRRSALQSVGTKSAKRRLKQISGRQRRFQANTNHVISKQLVAKAKGTVRGLALEDLTRLRERVTVRHAQRARHHNWAFGQLRSFVQYKAALAGVPVVVVDPRDTSRTCSVCGGCDKRNRVSQALFRCRSCGHAAPADVNAALNIAYRAVPASGNPMLPMVSDLRVQGQAALL